MVFYGRMAATHTTEPPDWLKKLTESYRQVRLGRGVVGKTGQAMLALLGVWAVIAWQWTDNIARDAGLLLAGTVISGVFIWWVRATQKFAQDNPAQAMLEGAEFIEYQKFEAQVKGLPPVSRTILTTDPKNPPSPTDVIVGEDQ
jgi:hypothetical protein